MVPFVHAPDLERRAAVRLSPRITRVIANNPGPFTYTGSGTYLLHADDETWVIDPGPRDEAHLALLVKTAEAPVTRLLITHTHTDHCGGAALLKEMTGATSYGYARHPSAPGEAPPALDEGADFSFVPEVELRHGDVVEGGGLRIEAVHTPGHIGNHLCFALAEERALFTGDHVMGWATTVVAPPDGDMAAYLESLDLLLGRDDGIYYPTHGAPITEPRAFVEAVKAHRLGRDRAILAELEAGPKSIPELVDAIYTDLAAPLKIAAGLNVQAHLTMHERKGGVERVEAGVYALA